MTVGTVVRLQVQRSRLKPGPAVSRVYDPSPLLEVEALEIDARGCVGLLGGSRFLDVHHADHPDTRNNGLANGLSMLPSTAYSLLRQRYGEHLATGVVGESVLLEMTGDWPSVDLLLETDGEPLLLTDVRPAAPCVEFTRFCLQRPVGPVDEGVRQAMSQLDGGARGYYARVTGHGIVTHGAAIRAVPRPR